MRLLFRLSRLVLRSLAALGVFVLLISAGLTAAIAYPKPFFPHVVSANGITVRSADPLESETVVRFLETLDLAPAVAGLPAYEGPLTVYVTGDGWRNHLFFPVSPNAGGVTYAAVAPRHLFLSGADFAADRLIKGEYIIAPPRTLTYYLRHEATHLAQARALGLWRFYAQPHWVREGLPDLAALGAPDIAAIAAALGDGPTELEHMIAYGTYPRERLLVHWAIEEFGPDFLLETNWNTDTAWAAFRAAP